MIYSNIDFTVVYIDPSADPGGDGSTPATAASSFGTLANNTLYLLRRTAEAFSVTLPTANSANTELVNVCFFGMPKSTDRLWDIVPADARSAWGSDTADYACVVADTGEMYGETKALTLPNVRCLFMYRCYLFRNGTSASSMIIDVTNDNSNASVAFENCKFGALGVDLENGSFTSAVSSQCNAYVHVKSARTFVFRDCIVHHVCGDDMYGGSSYAFHIENANYIAVQNIATYSVTAQWDMGGGEALYFGAGTGAMASYDNLEFHILQRGSYGYMPQLFRAANHNYCRVKNLSVDIPARTLGTGTPTNRIVYGSLIQCSGMREFRIEDIDINLPQCWRIESSGRILALSGYSSSSVPGGEHRIKNISIQLAETDGIDADYNGINYDWVKSTNYGYYAALALEFSSNDYPGLEITTAENITVNHPRGMAFYAHSLQLKNANFKGAVKVTRTMANIASLYSYYPGYALWASEGSTVRVQELEVTKATADAVGGVGDPIVGAYSNSLIYVDEANAALRDNQTSTETSGNQYGVICGNEADDGHFVHRSVNCICDTWNVNRTGGAPACYKLWNNALDTTSDLSLGRAPFLGVQITPAATGKHVFECFVATKNHAAPAELATRFIVQISVPNADGSRKVYFSGVDGQWLADSSVWNNDSDLTAYKLSLPLEVAVTDADIDVKVHFNWYSALGYLYLDPNFNLTAVGA